MEKERGQSHPVHIYAGFLRLTEPPGWCRWGPQPGSYPLPVHC